WYFGVERPGDRGAEVVEFGVEPRDPCGLFRPFQAGSGGFGEGGIVLGVAPAVILGAAGVVETFERVLTQRLEEPKASRGLRAVLEHDHRLGGQVVEDLSHIPGRDLVTSRDRGCGIGVETLGEHAKAVEDDALALAEERIRPFDGRSQRVMPLNPAATSTREKPEPVVE